MNRHITGLLGFSRALTKDNAIAHNILPLQLQLLRHSAAGKVTNRKHRPHLRRQFIHHALKLLVIPNISLTMTVIFRHDLRVALLTDSASHY